MNTSFVGERIALREVGQPRADDIHRPFLVTSLAMATLLGFVLGIHVPLGRLLGLGSPERTSDLIQAHGQVQLLGFAGLFVIGMSLRLMPRFAGSRLAFERLVPVTLWLLTSGLLVRALVMPWFSGDLHDALLLASLFAVLLSSACFLFIVFGTLAIEARRFDASSLAFILGATLLFAASCLATFAAIDAVSDGARGLPYLVSSAVVQLQMSGFIFSFILGVAVRAIPTMVGIERPGRSANLVVLLLAGSVSLLAASLVYLEYAGASDSVTRLADVGFLGFGVALLALVWQAGALRQAANRLRPASQTNLWLVRSAFLWLLVAAMTTVYFAISALRAGELPSPLEFDAVRHTLGAGVVTMLIVGMATMILPEFAADRMHANRQKQLSVSLVVLLNAATLLRVLPSLAGARWSIDDRNLSMALAGSLAELALLFFALYFIRLIRKSSREQARGGTHAI